ncbi:MULTISPECIES: type IX secretion system sortase PorU [Mesonia]|uniref:Uncharacterized protein n=1 Tax=Mesonia oceanica TaxID=2687242 RepID=A0AC61Y6I3_9FLAO|nr:MULTISPECIES: type IX secretion system sortase PorU [Mesonia]MAN28926.1 peptidase C25 [Mesonia sp.]MAQ42707.1 peptidase C25 [Mesonia sp.]MBJ99244.1 peptidase C25 [Flavobacteriaceae bacterium]VVU99757.1 hypothetical protein FVB9532_01016 [Mesonia oceanica]|tara:strand:- start:73923 stop:77696 length:3774 start_codon:yes stop_codon:yes gene_type:complete
MKFKITFFLLGCCAFAFAQQKTFSVNWGAWDSSLEEKEVSGLSLSYDHETKSFLYQNQWKSGSVSAEGISNVNYVLAPASILKKINISEVVSEIEFELDNAKAREESYAVLSLNPIVKRQGNIYLLTSFVLNYRNSVSSARTFDTPSMSNSIFATGNWYKFYVEKTGVHKITKRFLDNLGMNTSAINPNQLKIVGHGGDMLPLRNADNEYYDPPELAVKVVGGEDGSFDNGDYILFYGKAVDNGWSEENKTNLNLYADKSYYYITADGANGNRVATYVEPSGGVSVTYNTFDDYQYYEEDLYSIAHVGRRWFGDRYDVENEQSYDFTFPNLVTSEDLEIKVYAAAVSEIGTSMELSLNGDAQTLSFAAINDDFFGQSNTATFLANVNNDSFTVNVTYNNSGNPASVGYLDYINIWAKRELKVGNRQLGFRNRDAASQSGVALYNLSNTSEVEEVWDVTNITQIRSVENNQQPNFSFKANLGEIREYVALVSSDYYTPLIDNPSVKNVNIKGNIFSFNDSNTIDYLMVTPKELSQQATRLAEFRSEKDNLNIKVVLLEDIYQEFNSGKQDIGAIRNLVKYIYDNAESPSSRIKYVCLFGDASVDFKNRLPNNNNMVPVYERLSWNSVGSSSSASDDFYGMMGANEGNLEPGSPGILDIAVGRILADNNRTAKILVDKIIDYERKESYGRWRNNFVLISDDADKPGDYQLQVGLDQIGDDISLNKPFINVKKIHSDAYRQVSSSGGFRYPDVNKAITEAVEVGALVVNYFGHGGENGLAQERIVTINNINSWQNKDKYNLFVTVTCEFTRFDNPTELSPGEYNLLNENGGSAAMVTTTRTISVSTGTDFNQQIAPFLFNYDGGDDSIAEAVRKAKNNIGGSDKRVVFYFGDPAMKLAMPDPQIRLTTINEQPFSPEIDTLKALGRVKLGGEVQNAEGGLLSNYNGELSTVIFDKRIDRSTLNNDGEGVFDFTTLGEIIFRGKASVNNGKFEFDFVVPKDIAVPVGEGRISFYAEKNNELQDNTGYNNEILVGGINENAPEDNLGPEIQLYMNDENFVSGGITNSSPFLLAKLSDENGINTASGIGHDLVAILDGDETNPYVVNDYYETELDDYTQGTVNYKLRDLEEGLHTLTFKAWDVYNNSSTAEIQFRVTGDDELKITRVLNYPNPFHNYTEFWFNHNRPFEPLEVQVQVFTISGKIVWTKNQTITTDGFLAREITWNGKDDFGDAIGKGVYVYKLTVKSTLTNKKVEKFEKLVIL